jgi:HAD superfamily hydrolase (TIGR01509 family)
LDDEPIHQQLIEELLINENLRPQPEEFQQFCLGRSDRACLHDILTERGRFVNEAYLEKLIALKSQFYNQRLQEMPELPLFPGLEEILAQLKTVQIKLAIVTGALAAEVKAILTRAQLLDYFSVIVAAEDTTNSKPDPEGYLLAVKKLNQSDPDLQLTPANCLAIEDTFVGITAAKQAGIAVVGVAHTYPFHMLQRRANWAVDYLHDLEVERIQEIFSRAA